LSLIAAKKQSAVSKRGLKSGTLSLDDRDGRIAWRSRLFPMGTRLLDLQMLALLHLRAMNGYELRQALKQKFGREVSFGLIYPHLRGLERLGFLKADSGGMEDHKGAGEEGEMRGQEKTKKNKKRAFSLTDLGRENSLRGIEELQVLVKKLEQLVEARAEGVERTVQEEEAVRAVHGSTTVREVSSGNLIK
jgi:DNA-binding PadR family transcriptional regulator